jgi:DNA repair photolyase
MTNCNHLPTGHPLDLPMDYQIEYQEVNIQRILNPTSIDLGEYVINPYMGCAFNCLYCYVRSNRAVSRKAKPWGHFVDIRANAPALLEKELAKQKPATVLLGSTTECFQPCEEKYGITRKILEFLNGQGVYYIILTRSPLVVSALPLLTAGFCKRIYFTINNYEEDFKKKLEPYSPCFTEREKTIRTLLEAGIPVVPYFSPVLPWISNLKDVFTKFKETTPIEFECLNFSLTNIRLIIDKIGEAAPHLKEKYLSMLSNETYYNRVWEELLQNIQILADPNHNYHVHTHQFGDFFKNTYT